MAASFADGVLQHLFVFSDDVRVRYPSFTCFCLPIYLYCHFCMFLLIVQGSGGWILVWCDKWPSVRVPPLPPQLPMPPVLPWMAARPACWQCTGPTGIACPPITTPPACRWWRGGGCWRWRTCGGAGSWAGGGTLRGAASTSPQVRPIWRPACSTWWPLVSVGACCEHRYMLGARASAEAGLGAGPAGATRKPWRQAAVPVGAVGVGWRRGEAVAA